MKGSVLHWKGILVVLLAGFGIGCQGLQQNHAPDERYGHRYDADSPDGRETVLIVPPIDTAVVYDTFPAIFDSVHIRVAGVPGGSEQADHPVEVLIKGSFPDGCMELHALEQAQAGQIINVDLLMRRPRDAFCIQVVRPYRFYFPLDTDLMPGSYTLKVNNKAIPFKVQS